MRTTSTPNNHHPVPVQYLGKSYLLAAILLIVSFFAQAQTIKVTGVTTNPVVVGSFVEFTFEETSIQGNSVIHRYNPQTLYTVYLSSPGGVGPYSSIGNFTRNAATYCTASGPGGCMNTGITGTIKIPVEKLAGTYKISIGSSSPTFNGSTGAGASDNFTINDDLDDDNDGILDVVEPGGENPLADSNNNGIPNYRDPSYRSLTYNSVTGVNNFYDQDHDGIINAFDLDSDNDGLSDNLESQASGAARKFPLNSDTDKDGIDDQYDSSCGCTPNGNAISPVSTDNQDLVPDYLDVDSDKDQKRDLIEAYDQNNDGRSLDDLKRLAAALNTNTGSTYYTDQNLNANNVPGWLQDDDKDGLLNYLDFESSYYHDSDNDGWIDLFDVASYNSELVPNIAFRTNNIMVTLPVELLNFKAQFSGKATLLTWQTAAERQNDYFAVERSTDGITFTLIAKVPGAGNSNQLLNYSFQDEHSTGGLTYYRLKQVSLSKQAATSKVVSVDSPIRTQVSSQAYPNPTLGTFNLDITLPVSKVLTITIRENTGKLIRTQTVEALTGRNTVPLDLGRESNGVYIITIQGPQVHQALYPVKGY